MRGSPDDPARLSPLFDAGSGRPDCGVHRSAFHCSIQAAHPDRLFSTVGATPVLISIVLTLQASSDLVLPAAAGQANYAALLARIREKGTAAAESLEDSKGPKPITCSNLLGISKGRDFLSLGADQQVAFRFTGLTQAASTALVDSLLEHPPVTWPLANQLLQVAAVTCDPNKHSWAGRTTYEELAAEPLRQLSHVGRQVTLEFASPTAFKSRDQTVPFPLPGLVFGNLAERWNRFSLISLSPEIRRYSEELIAISHYKLESRSINSSNASLRIGSVGKATYQTLTGDRYWMGVMQTLASFAFYAGVGVQTTAGMGQVRRIGT